jgi:hypothetical protein
MANGCVWIIGIGEVDGVAQTVAAQLKPYGLAIEGQKWPVGEKQAWLASADAAAAQAAQVVIVVASKSDHDEPTTRRELAFFRLALQTQLGKPVAGFVILTDAPETRNTLSANTPFSILGDWEVVSGGNWAAKVVARFHAPRQPKWPVKLGLIAREKLGVWLTVSPLASQSAEGCLVGVSGNEADISFHAVGPAGGLPETSINEYELKGIEFEAGGQPFKAWALQNTIGPDQAYYVRLEGEPSVIAVGQLPNGQVDGVDLIAVA